MMKFTIKNKEEIRNLYTHDSVFEGFAYDYGKRKLSVSLMNEERRITLTFNDIIFLDMQAYGLWGKGIERIYDMWLEEESDYLNEARKVLAEEKEEYPKCYEHAPEMNYIQINLQILSGDKIIIICESFDWDESIL